MRWAGGGGNPKFGAKGGPGSRCPNGVPRQNSTQPGIMIWAAGRSGTTSFWETLNSWVERAGMSIAPLCGLKEPFHERREVLSQENWLRCLAENSGPHFEHIKPMHLVTAKTKALQTPEGMFLLAHRMGVKVVVTVDRKNWLARKVSAGERYMADVLGKRNTPNSEARIDFMNRFFGYKNETETKEEWLERNSHFEMEDAEELDRGKDIARQLGLRVLTFTYRKDGWPCDEVNRTLEAAVQEGVFPRHPQGPCTMKHGVSDGSSFHELTLEQRVGPEAAAIIQDALTGSRDEWMLDLEKEGPPPGHHSSSGAAARFSDPL